MAKIFIELVTIFAYFFFLRETWNKIVVPNLLQRFECGATKLHVYKMVDAVHGKSKRKPNYFTC